MNNGCVGFYKYLKTIKIAETAKDNVGSRRALEENPKLVYTTHVLSFVLAFLMDTGLEGEQENEEKQPRLRSKTTPTGTNQFAMSSSRDSGVGSFDESDTSEKSCMKNDYQSEKSRSEEQSTAHPQRLPHQGASSFRFIYLGSVVLDKRYTQAMLPWVIAEVRRKKERVSIVLNVEAMTVKAIDGSGNTLFQHEVQIITRCALTVDKKCFSYLTKISGDVSSCQSYVFEAVEPSSVNGFLQGIRDAAKQAADQNTLTAKENGVEDSSLPVNNSSLDAQAETPSENLAVIFPLWYMGKVMVSHRQAPPTLIDDLVEKFHKRLGMLDLEKQMKVKKDEQKEASPCPDVKIGSHSSERLLAKASSFDSAQILQEEPKIAEEKTEGVGSNKMQFLSANSNSGGRPRSASDGDKMKELYSSKTHGNSSNQHGGAKMQARHFSLHAGENRNVLFKISVQSLSCLSVTTKQQLMERRLREVSFCQQGTKAPEHFGFICHDSRSGQYSCYVFKGQSEQLVDDVMQSLRQAFNSAWQSAGPSAVCDMCPLHQLHQLCVQLDGRTIKQQYDILQRHRINLTDEEMNEFTEIFKAENPSPGMSEENEVIMAIFRGIYEQRQKQHTHIGQGNPSQKNREGSNLLQKAKKSLSSSFGSFMSKRGKPRTIEEGNEMEKCESGKLSPGLLRKRSATVDTVAQAAQTQPVAPLKESSTHKEDEVFTSIPHRHSKQVPPLQAGEGSPSHLSKKQSGSASSPPPTPTKTPQGHHRRLSRHNSYGYRQAIFHSVVTPSKKETAITDQDLGVVPQSASWAEMVGRSRSAAELRALWRKAIMEQILLIRMEKENTSLEVNVNEIETNQLKLSYEEISPCSESAATSWKMILDKGDVPVDRKVLLDAVKAGVPKARRGEVWRFLAKQHEFYSPSPEDKPWMQKSFEELKEVSSSHQHSIFIDLGRTFPNHPYFAAQLGRGQLCLFNVLKAYSVLDEEVGYCQGLSFVAGILLMHMREAEAFDMLRFILYTLQVRTQYKPDMQKLQIQFYMLSRLFHDYYNPVYEYLLECEISPTLYAAPWFLTLFASHFPIGFVARVLDMMFLQGMDVIFKVILLLLGSCEEELLASDGLEGAVEVIKLSVPPFAKEHVEWLVDQALSLDVSKDLESYEVEYCVFKEEDLSVTEFEEIESEKVECLEAELEIKTKQIQYLNEQLSSARHAIHGLESTISTMQINQTELLTFIRSLEAENESLKKNFEKLKDKVLANGDVAPEVGEVDEQETIEDSLTDCTPTCAEMNASFTEENTDSFEHIGSADDLSDNEVVDGIHEETPGATGATLPLSDKCEDLVVSR